MKRKPAEKFSWGNVPQTDVLDSLLAEIEAGDRDEVLATATKKSTSEASSKLPSAPQPALPPSKKAREKIDYAKYLPANWKEQKETRENSNAKNPQTEIIEVDASELHKSKIDAGSESTKWELVATVSACRDAVKILRSEKLLGVDCEGVNLSRTGKICLIQISTRSERVFLFDMLSEGSAMMKDGGLKEVLESPSSVKILHDCRNDSDALWHQYGVLLRNVFDTQIGYAVVCQDLGRGTPLPVGLNTLLRMYAMGRDNPYKETARAQMEQNSLYWEQRPMSETALQYARFDVMLLPLLHKQLEAVMTAQSKNIVKKYSAQYIDQYRLMAQRLPEQDRTARSASTAKAGEASGTKPSDERFIPSYGIEQWDTEARSRMGLDRKSRIKALAS